MKIRFDLNEFEIFVIVGGLPVAIMLGLWAGYSYGSALLASVQL